MADSKPTFVDFLRGVLNPKLAWIMAQLAMLGIIHRENGVCINGPVLQVQEGQVEQAFGVLNTTVGVMEVSGSLTDDSIKVMDLPDDHPIFTSGIDIEELPITPATDVDTSGWDLDPAPTVVEEDDPFSIVEQPEVIVPNVIPAEIMGSELATPQPLAPESNVVAMPEPLKIVPPSPVAIENDDPFAEDSPEADALWDIDENVPPSENPELDYLRADKVLQFGDTQFAKVEGTVRMYETDSGNLARIGAKISQKDQTKCTFYGEFQGDPTKPYRYGPVPVAKFNDILGEAVRKAEGHQNVSVGSMYHNLIKVDAEAGTVACQRLIDGKWQAVLPKSQRVKAAKKKHEGK